MNPGQGEADGMARGGVRHARSTVLSRARVLAVLVVVSALGFQAWAQGRLETLISSGPTASRINIVVLSEGYTATDLNWFPDDARTVVNHLLGTSPYSAYRGYFNAFALSVASTQSGSDHPGRGVFRNTYFNSTYESYGIDYLVTIPPNDRDGNYANGQGKVDTLLQQFMPEYDIVLMLVNDTEYGGSGGSTAITSLNASAREIAVHELGHSFGRLGDEYDTAYPGYPDTEEPNTTRETRRSFIKWTSWILAETPVPTPETSTYSSKVGLFEGAHYHATGWYRPKLNCKMQALGRSFCEVCAEALVLSGYRLLDPIESTLPSTPSLNVSNAPVTLTAVLPTPTLTPLAVQWWVNGVVQAGETNATFTVQPTLLIVGSNTVRVAVHDPTPLVRTDPTHLLEGSHTWTLIRSVVLPEFRLSAPARLADGAIRFDVPMTGGRRVVIQGADGSFTWRNVFTNEGNAPFAFTNRAVPQPALHYFRARSEP